MSNWFVKDSKGKERTGVLMKIEEDEHSRYRFEVWFEYTRRAMNEIREGTMLAVWLSPTMPLPVTRNIIAFLK